MARRMTDTAKWDDDWFMNLSPATKLLWLYLCDRCDHAGLWRVNRKLADMQMGRALDWQKAEAEIGDRIQLVGDDRWYIRKFVVFQYGPVFKDTNNAHKSVKRILDSFSLSWPLLAPAHPHPSPLPGALEKERDKDLDMDSRESPERGAEEQRAEFLKMLRRLRVADGKDAAARWWSLALDTKAKSFEDRLDAIWWAITEGKERGIKVRFATDVEAIAMEWRPKPSPEKETA